MSREKCREMVEGICREHDCLNRKQRNALGNMLFGYYEDATSDYSGAVDFLWMSDEIDLNTKLELLDLM